MNSEATGSGVSGVSDNNAGANNANSGNFNSYGMPSVTQGYGRYKY
jgi:hypothetical protein